MKQCFDSCNYSGVTGSAIVKLLPFPARNVFSGLFSQIHFNCHGDGNCMAFASRNNLYFYLQNMHISFESASLGVTPASLLK